MRSDQAPAMRSLLLLACLAALAASGCSREDGDAGNVATTAADADEARRPLPPAATMHPDDVAEVTASYDCDGIRVDIVRDQVARVNLAVDNIVKIERIANSVPATYQDVGLTFSVSGTGANLDDETGRSFACKPVAKPGGA